jgi:hypothetical protein
MKENCLHGSGPRSVGGTSLASFLSTQTWEKKEPTYSERSTIGNPNWQIREHGNRSVETRTPKRQIMADLMDSKKQILIRGGPNNIRSQEKGPGEEGRVAEGVSASNLQ